MVAPVAAAAAAAQSVADAKAIAQMANRVTKDIRSLVRSRQFSIEKTSLEWFGDQRHLDIDRGLMRRMETATTSLRHQIVRNLTKNTVKFVAHRRTGSIHVIRSKPGQFPFMDTGVLTESIKSEQKYMGNHSIEGYVHTATPYAVPLELVLDRSFLRRTLWEHYGTLKRIFERRLTREEMKGSLTDDFSRVVGGG